MVEGFLTPDEARTAELSRNPWARHSQVRGHIEGLEEQGFDVAVNPLRTVELRRGELDITLHRILPLLGRKALIVTAQAIELSNRLEDERSQ